MTFVSEKLFNDGWYTVYNYNLTLKGSFEELLKLARHWQDHLLYSNARISAFQPIGRQRYFIQCLPYGDSGDSGDHFQIFFSLASDQGFGSQRKMCAITCMVYSYQDVGTLLRILKGMTAEIMITLGDNAETVAFIKSMNREELETLLQTASNHGKIKAYLQTAMPDFYKERSRAEIADDLEEEQEN